MSKLNQTIQGNIDTHVFKCYCGENSYLDVMQDPEDHEFYISITLHPTRLSQRVKLAWKALKGLEFEASNEIVLLHSDAKKLAKVLATPSKPNTKKDTK